MARFRPSEESIRTALAPTVKVCQRLAITLQELLAAERAGARVAARSIDQAIDVTQRDLLRRIHRGETDSCRRLRASLVHLGLDPGTEIGAFEIKAMTIPDMTDRLAFIDRGQGWVIRRVKEQLSNCEDATVRAHLKAVLDTHEVNSRAYVTYAQDCCEAYRNTRAG